MINVKGMADIAQEKLKLLTKKGRIIKKNFHDKKHAKTRTFIEEVLEEVEQNRNHTWFEEIYSRNQDNLDAPALFYRGTEISYREMFEKMKEYAKSLKAMDVGKGTEIPICMSNTPELVFLLGAISMVGAKANIFNDEFDKDYITEIIDGCNAQFMFVEDRKYPELQGAIANSHISKIIMTSLMDSLPKTGNPYEEYDKVHGQFKSTVLEHKQNNPNILDINEFMVQGEQYNGELFADVSLDDEFTITYSSGSTNSSRAKAIVHANRSFIAMGRAHDPEVQNTSSMRKYTVQAHIPTHSNTDIISGLSDSFMQGAKVALEPIYDKEFFLNSLLINKPTYIMATRSFWVDMAKKILYNPKYQGTKLNSLFLAFSVGEPLEKNEEKLINKALRKADAAKDMIPAPVSPAAISYAGGDCEHGGIFYVVFRAFQNKKPSQWFKKDAHGMKPFKIVETAVLDREGHEVAPYEMGRLVANSPCTMKEYKNNPEATQKFFIKDANGKVWGDCNVYGYKDEAGNVHMKGRIPATLEETPPFMISDVILRDTKNILSCETIYDEDSGYYIAHVEMQPEKRKSDVATIVSGEKRCQKAFGEEFTRDIVYRIHSNEESFALTGCGKRNSHALRDEGLTEKCVKPCEVGYDGKIKLVPVMASSDKVYKNRFS